MLLMVHDGLQQRFLASTLQLSDCNKKIFTNENQYTATKMYIEDNFLDVSQV